MSGRIKASLFWVALGWGFASGQGGYTRRDSGWVPLFNGKIFEGLYIHDGATLKNPAAQSSFEIKDGAIYVPRNGGVGHIATQAI